MHETSGETEAVILIKASPQVGTKRGETVCCAGITMDGNWVRLYPVAFRKLEDAQQFSRWDRVRFKWHKPKDDVRPESRRVEQDSIEIIGELQKNERAKLLNRLEVTGLKATSEAGKSLALLRPQQPKFLIKKKLDADIERERRDYNDIVLQGDILDQRILSPLQPCPYEFKYRYVIDEGEREGTCQDWETDATFFYWRKRYGETQALEMMMKRFGEEYPEKGMTFAMGTHSRYPEKWLINGVIRTDEVTQLSLL